MRRTWLTLCALLTVSTLGCEQINTQWGKVKAAIDRRRGRVPATATSTPPTAPRDTSKRPGAARPPATPTRPTPGPGQRLTARDMPRAPEGAYPQPPLRDTPYHSLDTGTVAPGMSEREVYQLWGAPAAVRRSGEWTYLFFRNGCERSCGTMDLVTLQNDKVVDAVVRWPGHVYSGESSSPPGKKHGPTRGGDTLHVSNP